MWIDRECFNCSYPADPKYSVLINGLWIETYCSVECKRIRTQTIFIVALGFILIGLIYQSAMYFGFVILIAGQLFVLYNQRLASIRSTTRSEYSQIAENRSDNSTTPNEPVLQQHHPRPNNWITFSSYPSTDENDGLNQNRKLLIQKPKLIYSIILDEKVNPCCYQTARLSETFCMCGRGLKYQQKLETIT
ncbi:MAG: hypothetical protein GPJ54_18280 [Candidatus Heimdallarchaeota archaeon]|nr:hypothetical protein [Candidatus Heimdallarchaeota archaeon]